MLKFTLVLLVLYVSSSTLAEGQQRSCRKKLTTLERCDNPPVVDKVTLTSYIGKWYQIFVSGAALRFSENSCVTANYTLVNDSPIQIAVLNCQTEDNGEIAQCVRANATKQPNAQFDSQLQVQFFPQLPPQRYSIAALVGLPNHGYQAAAVYTCSKFPPKFQPDDGFFIISRTPYAPVFVLKRLIRQLRCNGYKNVNFRSFTPSGLSKDCKYFDGPGSFNVTRPIPSF